MNSVHLVTQEKYRVEPGQKQAECTECTAQSQPAGPGRAPRACCRAQPRALRFRPPTLRAPRAPAPAACAQRLPARLPAARPACTPALCPRAPAPAARPARALACCHACCIATQAKPPHNTSWPTVLQYTPAPSRPVLQYTLLTAHLRPLCCNTNPYIAIQFQPSKLPSLQYKNCIAIQIFFFFHNIIGQ